MSETPTATTSRKSIHSEICQEPQPPTYKAKINEHKSDKRWPKLLEKTKESNSFRPYFCSYFCLVCEGGVTKRSPNHHYFSRKYRNTPPNLYCNMPPICIAVLPVPLRSEEKEILSVLLPFVSQYASHLYCNTPPMRFAVLWGKSWWLWSPGCSPIKFVFQVGFRVYQQHARRLANRSL